MNHKAHRRTNRSHGAGVSNKGLRSRPIALRPGQPWRGEDARARSSPSLTSKGRTTLVIRRSRAACVARVVVLQM